MGHSGYSDHSTVLSKDKTLELVEEYGVNQLEANLALVFLDQLNIENVENKFLQTVLSEATLEDAKYIKKEAFGSADPDLTDILRVFEMAVPEKNRELNGVYYTPEKVVQYMTSEVIEGDKLVCDPACGGGAFLLEATKVIHRSTEKKIAEVIEENIYGADILASNIRKAKTILLLYAASQERLPGEVDFNLRQLNSLRIEWDQEFSIPGSNRFDVVIGNPPYIKIQNQSEETKDHLLESYMTINRGNFNTYIPFIELATNLINDNGEVCFITPLNYFTTLTGKDLREFLQENKYISKIVDFGDILLFEDALIYTAITFIDKRNKSEVEYVKISDGSQIDSLHNQKPINIKYTSLSSEKWRLLDDTEYRNINKIESHQQLDKVANIHTGIATLKDGAYTVMADARQDGYYVAEYKGEEYLIEPEVCRELVKISTIENENGLKDNDRKIIFPYRRVSSQLSLEMENSSIEYEIIPPDELAERYPKTYEYLNAVRGLLSTREKGGGKDYQPWYKYGREQGFYSGKRLYIPTYSDGPQFMLHENEDALFCNGYAIFPKREKIEVLEKILNSFIMDYYMKRVSKDIQGGYQCYQKNFIRRFSVPEMNTSDKEFLLSQNDPDEIDDFLIEKYELDVDI